MFDANMRMLPEGTVGFASVGAVKPDGLYSKFGLSVGLIVKFTTTKSGCRKSREENKKASVVLHLDGGDMAIHCFSCDGVESRMTYEGKFSAEGKLVDFINGGALKYAMDILKYEGIDYIVGENCGRL